MVENNTEILQVAEMPINTARGFRNRPAKSGVSRAIYFINNDAISCFRVFAPISHEIVWGILFFAYYEVNCLPRGLDLSHILVLALALASDLPLHSCSRYRFRISHHGHVGPEIAGIVQNHDVKRT
jgi:hypothetical protein